MKTSKRKLVVLVLLVLLNAYVISMRRVEAAPGDCETCILTDAGSGICVACSVEPGYGETGCWPEQDQCDCILLAGSHECHNDN